MYPESRQGVDEMKLRVVVEYDSEVDSYTVYCPERPGCTSAGDSAEEALENIKEAITLYLEPTPVTYPMSF